MTYVTYILYSSSTDSFYKGHTSNIGERVSRHNSSLEKYTRKGVPWVLIWSVSKATKSEAYRLEMKLKNLNRSRLIAFMLKYSEGIAGHDELLFLEQLS